MKTIVNVLIASCTLVLATACALLSPFNLDSEARNVVASRRSLCATRDLPAGTVLTAADLIALRPATGLPPAILSSVVGQRLAHALTQGESLLNEHLAVRLTALEQHRVA